MIVTFMTESQNYPRVEVEMDSVPPLASTVLIRGEEWKVINHTYSVSVDRNAPDEGTLQSVIVHCIEGRYVRALLGA